MAIRTIVDFAAASENVNGLYNLAWAQMLFDADIKVSMRHAGRDFLRN